MKIKNWDEINDQLKRLGVLQARVDKLIAKCDRAHQKADADFERNSKSLVAEIEDLDTAITKFSLKHEADFDGRTKKLEAGTISLKTVTSHKIPNPKITIALLKKNKMMEAVSVKTTESVLVSALQNLSEKELARYGVVRHVETRVILTPAQ